MYHRSMTNTIATTIVRHPSVRWAITNRGLVAALATARAIAANERVQAAYWAEDAAGWGDSERTYRECGEETEAALAVQREAQRIAAAALGQENL